MIKMLQVTGRQRQMEKEREGGRERERERGTGREGLRVVGIFKINLCFVILAESGRLHFNKKFRKNEFSSERY